MKIMKEDKNNIKQGDKEALIEDLKNNLVLLHDTLVGLERIVDEDDSMSEVQKSDMNEFMKKYYSLLQDKSDGKEVNLDFILRNVIKL